MKMHLLFWHIGGVSYKLEVMGHNILSVCLSMAQTARLKPHIIQYSKTREVYVAYKIFEPDIY